MSLLCLPPKVWAQLFVIGPRAANVSWLWLFWMGCHRMNGNGLSDYLINLSFPFSGASCSMPTRRTPGVKKENNLPE